MKDLLDAALNSPPIADDDDDDVDAPTAADGFDVVSNGIVKPRRRCTAKEAAAAQQLDHRQRPHHHNNNDLNHRSGLPPATGTEAADVTVAGAVDDDGDGDVEDSDYVPTRVQILLDPANLCTLAGAILATLAMACMWKGRYYTGMCLNVAANVADIIDGPIARSTPNRRPAFGVVGCKLDCYSDLVSHFVVPASVLMHISDGSIICTALAAFYVCAGILRQSYFEVTGRCADGECIYGVTSDYMVAIYVLAMHLMPLLGRPLMPFVLTPCVVLMITASLTFAVRSRRYSGFGLLTVTAYNVSLCMSCLGLLLLVGDDLGAAAAGSSLGLPVLLFGVHLVLAYPMYFRFVELNR